MLTLDSPKVQTTDPWGAPVPTQQTNKGAWGMSVAQPPPPQATDPWQSPARAASPPQSSTDPWGMTMSEPQQPPPYASVAASGSFGGRTSLIVFMV